MNIHLGEGHRDRHDEGNIAMTLWPTKVPGRKNMDGTRDLKRRLQ